MPPADARVDADTLEAELEWLAHVIELRLHHYFHDKAPGSPPLPGALAPPPVAAPEVPGRTRPRCSATASTPPSGC
jgi:hypothetical protein